jgi:hypothetical protein
LFRRRNKLTFTHHEEVCVIDEPAIQDQMLDWCEEPIADPMIDRLVCACGVSLLARRVGHRH